MKRRRKGCHFAMYHASNLAARAAGTFVLGLQVFCAASAAAEDRAADAPREEAAHAVVGLTVEPSAIDLDGAFAYQQLLVTGTLASGESVDLTRAARYEQSAPLLEISTRGLVRPAKNGTARLSITVAGKSVQATVNVSGVGAPRTPSFVRDVNPVLTRLGCNAGTCHGSKHGKNGFKLSLRGYDPVHDHRALTDDIAARRFNRAAPEQSLMLLKASGAVPHEGGALLRPGQPHYELLRQWIASGARLDAAVPRVAKITVQPQEFTIPRAGMAQQVRVVAHYDDGSTRDVTGEAFIEPSDVEVLAVERPGLVSAVRRGEGAVLARYEGAYVAAPAVVMGSREGFQWQAVPAYNYIDELVYRKQRGVKVQPGPLCSDADFVRRIYLDLTGLPPTADQVRDFLADQRPARAKREALVDRLIGSPDFVEHGTRKWCDLLQVNAKFLGHEGAEALRGWVRQQIERNTPYDEFVYQILTASGSTRENPPAAYYKILRSPEVATENTTHLFLATRFNCNKCHDHPFERWTQDQYYQLAAFFAEVKRTEDQNYKDQTIGGTAVQEKQPLVEVISDAGTTEVKHERTGQIASPQFPYEHDAMPAPERPLRAQLARWLTAPQNPYFARSYVNRVWSYLLGVGLIEPVDDIRAGNPPTNPELLEAMTARFVADGFDVRKLIATICKSRTYQLNVATERWNHDDRRNYARALPRRLPAEVLYDAIHRALGSRSRIPGLPEGSRAAVLVDPAAKLPDGFLDRFGRPARESACECERSTGVMLGAVMNLIMGPTLNDALTDPHNKLATLVASEPDDARVVAELYLSILNRPATAAEIKTGVVALQTKLNEADLNRLRGQLAKLQRRLDAQLPAWEASLAAPHWHMLKPAKLHSAAGAEMTVADDGSVFVGGKLDKDVYTLTLPTELPMDGPTEPPNPLRAITGLRLEVLADQRLPKNGPGRSRRGNFVLNELLLRSGPDGPQIPLARPQADFSQTDFDIAAASDGNPETGWAVSPEVGRNHTAVFETQVDAASNTASPLVVQLVQQYKDKKHQIGRFRISVTTSRRPVTLHGPPPEIAPIVATPVDRRSDAQRAELREFFYQLDGDHRRLRAEIERLQRIAENPRLVGVQDLAWALINSPAFIFNR